MTGRMEGRRALLSGLVGLLLSTGAWALTEDIKAVGDVVILVPHYTGDPSEINWKKDGNKVVDMELRPESSIHFYRLYDRATIEATNGRLTIRDLIKEDSGVYKAEALVDNIIQETDIRLIALDCPEMPTIRDLSSESEIHVVCECSTPGVTYDWMDNMTVVSKSQSYNFPRPGKDVTLTCVVDNVACRRNASLSIPYVVVVGGVGRGDIAGIIVALVVFSAIIIITIISFLILLWFCPDRSWAAPAVSRIRRFFPGFAGGTPSNKLDPIPESQHLMTNGGAGDENDLEKGGASENGDMKVNEICGSLKLNVMGAEPVQWVKFERSDLPSLEVYFGGNEIGEPTEIVKFCVTINEWKPDCEITADVHLKDGEIRSFPVRGRAREQSMDPHNPSPDEFLIIDDYMNPIHLTVLKANNVKKMVLRTDDQIRYQWAVSGLRLQADNISLDPASLTISNLKHEDSGEYRAEVCSAGNSTSNVFHVAVVKQISKEKVRKVELNVVRKEPPLPDDEAVGSITFHLSNGNNPDLVTRKKGDKSLVEDGRFLSENGNKLKENVTSEDEGTHL